MKPASRQQWFLHPVHAANMDSAACLLQKTAAAQSLCFATPGLEAPQLLQPLSQHAQDVSLAFSCSA